MNMRMDSSHLTPPQADAQVTGARVVLVTQSSIHAFWLAGALGNAAQVISPVESETAFYISQFNANNPEKVSFEIY